MASHTPRQEGKEMSYTLELQEGENFYMPDVGSLLVMSHFSLFAIAYKEKTTSRLRYCATQSEREEESGHIAVSYLCFTNVAGGVLIYVCASEPGVCVNACGCGCGHV